MTVKRFILADVGGTNARFALGDDTGVLKNTIIRYHNDDFDSFQHVLETYVSSEKPTNISGVSFAVAGPVSRKTAQLTNRPWHLDRTAIAATTGSGTIHIVNDMAALGHATKVLTSAQTTPWNAVSDVSKNGQSLVIGIGTGINVSARTGSDVMAAEIGHSSLTVRMAALLNSALGTVVANTATVEDYLSGRGLQNLHKARTGKTICGADITTAAATGSDLDAVETCKLFGALCAEAVFELALHYLPKDGIYLAGSVARGLFPTPARDVVASALCGDLPIHRTLSEIPVSLITDDAAALHGCLEIVKTAS